MNQLEITRCRYCGINIIQQYRLREFHERCYQKFHFFKNRLEDKGAPRYMQKKHRTKNTAIMIKYAYKMVIYKKEPALLYNKILKSLRSHTLHQEIITYINKDIPLPNPNIPCTDKKLMVILHV